MPGVSVVIPTHNRRDSCRLAIESVLAQTVAPLEVIVCDDRSTDGTGEMVQALAASEPRVRYLRREQGPAGPGPTRNAGVALARGEWLGFLDDDDRWLPTLLERELDAARDGFDVVAANAHRSSGGLYFPGAPARQVVERRALLHANPIIISTAIVRRTLVEDVGAFPPERWLTAIEDYELWLRLADRGARMVVLGEPLAEYEDAGQVRLSAAPLKTELALVRLMFRHWRASPADAQLARAAANRTVGASRLAARTLRRRSRGSDAHREQ